MNGWLERILFFLLGVLVTGAVSFFTLYSDKQVVHLKTEQNQAAINKNNDAIDAIKDRLSVVESNQRRIMDRLEMAPQGSGSRR